MRHDWIFDVLSDLRSYALKNGMPGLAAQVEATLQVARAEIATTALATGEATEAAIRDADVIAGEDDGSDDGLPPTGRAH
jgi:hypothetical protein